MAGEKRLAAYVPGQSADDAVLVEQARNGDMTAFGHLVARYQDRVVNTCWRMCGCLDDAQDIAQEAFLNALQSLESFRGRSSFYTWLFRIAVNLSLSHRRKRARRPVLSLHTGDDEPMYGDAAMRVVSVDDDPSARLHGHETQRLVADALEAMDDDHRAVLVLRDIEGFDYTRIAEVLELPVGTVKSRLARGRLALRERLKARGV